MPVRRLDASERRDPLHAVPGRQLGAALPPREVALARERAELAINGRLKLAQQRETDGGAGSHAPRVRPARLWRKGRSAGARLKREHERHTSEHESAANDDRRDHAVQFKIRFFDRRLFKRRGLVFGR